MRRKCAQGGNNGAPFSSLSAASEQPSSLDEVDPVLVDSGEEFDPNNEDYNPFMHPSYKLKNKKGDEEENQAAPAPVQQNRKGRPELLSALVAHGAHCLSPSSLLTLRLVHKATLAAVDALSSAPLQHIRIQRDTNLKAILGPTLPRLASNMKSLSVLGEQISPGIATAVVALNPPHLHTLHLQAPVPTMHCFINPNAFKSLRHLNIDFFFVKGIQDQIQMLDALADVPWQLQSLELKEMDGNPIDRDPGIGPRLTAICANMPSLQVLRLKGLPINYMKSSLSNKFVPLKDISVGHWGGEGPLSLPLLPNLEELEWLFIREPSKFPLFSSSSSSRLSPPPSLPPPPPPPPPPSPSPCSSSCDSVTTGNASACSTLPPPLLPPLKRLSITYELVASQGPTLIQELSKCQFLSHLTSLSLSVYQHHNDQRARSRIIAPADQLAPLFHDHSLLTGSTALQELQLGNWQANHVVLELMRFPQLTSLAWGVEDVLDRMTAFPLDICSATIPNMKKLRLYANNLHKGFYLQGSGLPVLYGFDGWEAMVETFEELEEVCVEGMKMMDTAREALRALGRCGVHVTMPPL